MLGKLLCRLGLHDFTAPRGVFPGAVLTRCRRCLHWNDHTLAGMRHNEETKG